MADQTQKKQCVAALKNLGGSADNGKLRDELGWEEPIHSKVKADLPGEGIIEPGRGRGGSVGLVGRWYDALAQLEVSIPEPSFSRGGERAAARPRPSTPRRTRAAPELPPANEMGHERKHHLETAS